MRDHGGRGAVVRILRDRSGGAAPAPSAPLSSLGPDAWLALSIEAGLRRRWLQRLQQRAGLDAWIPWIARPAPPPAGSSTGGGGLLPPAFAVARHWQALSKVAEVLHRIQVATLTPSALQTAFPAFTVHILAGRTLLLHTIEVDFGGRGRYVLLGPGLSLPTQPAAHRLPRMFRPQGTTAADAAVDGARWAAVLRRARCQPNAASAEPRRTVGVAGRRLAQADGLCSRRPSRPILDR